MEFSWPEYWSCSLSLLQRIFPTQESNQDLLHRRQILVRMVAFILRSHLPINDFVCVCADPVLEVIILIALGRL